jgi:hypothetical protein
LSAQEDIDMPITNRAEYEQEGSAQAEERAALAAELRAWDDAHRGENAHGPDSDTDVSLDSPDDMPVSGLPGNLGKLNAR